MEHPERDISPWTAGHLVFDDTDNGFIFSLIKHPSLWLLIPYLAASLLGLGVSLAAIDVVFALVPLGWIVAGMAGMVGLMVAPHRLIAGPREKIAAWMNKRSWTHFTVGAQGLLTPQRAYPWAEVANATVDSQISLPDGTTLSLVGLSDEEQSRLLTGFVHTSPVQLPAFEEKLEKIADGKRQAELKVATRDGLDSPTKLQLTTTIDGFAFRVPPRSSALGCLVFPVAMVFAALLGAAVTAPIIMFLPEIFLGPSALLFMMIWLGGSAMGPVWAQMIFKAKNRRDFVVDRLGLLAGETRYDWDDVGQPKVSERGMTLANGTRFRWGSLAKQQTEALTQHFAAARPCADSRQPSIPEEIGQLMAKQGQAPK